MRVRCVGGVADGVWSEPPELRHGAVFQLPERLPPMGFAVGARIVNEKLVVRSETYKLHQFCVGDDRHAHYWVAAPISWSTGQLLEGLIRGYVA